jgi:hypothetical protein
MPSLNVPIGGGLTSGDGNVRAVTLLPMTAAVVQALAVVTHCDTTKRDTRKTSQRDVVPHMKRRHRPARRHGEDRETRACR